MSATPSPAGTMKPVFAAGAAFVFTRKGVYFRNNAGSAMLEGEPAKELVRALAPFLDGNHSLAELVAAVSEPKRAALQRILNWLIERRIVIDAGRAAALAASGIPGDIAEYLTSLGVSSVPALRVHVAGDAEIAPLVTETAHASGFCLETSPADADVVLYAGRDIDGAVDLARRGVPLVSALLHPPGAWITSGCAGCLARRLAEHPSPDAAAADSLTSHLAAALLVRTALHRLATVATAGVLVWDAAERITATHTLLPHPRCSLCAPRKDDWRLSFALRLSAAIPATPESHPRLETAEERTAALEPAVDDALGPILRLHEEDFTQLPFSRSAVLAVNPTGGAPVRFVASGLDYYESRLRAATAALEWYAATLSAVESDGLLWALRVPSLEPLLVSAVATLAPEVTTASGWSYEELLGRAILGAALQGAVTPQGPLDVESLASNRVSRLLRAAGRLGMHVDLRQARTRFDVPAVIAREGDRQTIAAGMSLADAAEEALLALLSEQCGPRVAAVTHPQTVSTRHLLDAIDAAGAGGILIPHAAIPCRGRALLVAGFTWSESR